MVRRGALGAAVWAVRLEHGEARGVQEIEREGPELVGPAAREARVDAEAPVVVDAGPLVADVAPVAPVAPVETDQVVAADLDALRRGVGDVRGDGLQVGLVPRLESEAGAEAVDHHLEADVGHLVHGAAEARGRRVRQVEEDRVLRRPRREAPHDLVRRQLVALDVEAVERHLEDAEARERVDGAEADAGARRVGRVEHGLDGARVRRLGERGVVPPEDLRAVRLVRLRVEPPRGPGRRPVARDVLLGEGRVHGQELDVDAVHDDVRRAGVDREARPLGEQRRARVELVVEPDGDVPVPRRARRRAERDVEAQALGRPGRVRRVAAAVLPGHGRLGRRRRVRDVRERLVVDGVGGRPPQVRRVVLVQRQAADRIGDAVEDDGRLGDDAPQHVLARSRGRRLGDVGDRAEAGSQREGAREQPVGQRDCAVRVLDEGHRRVDGGDEPVRWQRCGSDFACGSDRAAGEISNPCVCHVEQRFVGLDLGRDGRREGRRSRSRAAPLLVDIKLNISLTSLRRRLGCPDKSRCGMRAAGSRIVINNSDARS